LLKRFSRLDRRISRSASVFYGFRLILSKQIKQLHLSPDSDFIVLQAKKFIIQEEGNREEASQTNQSFSTH
jgi:hypothetical protein